MLDLLGAQSDERQLRLATEVASGLRALTVAGILATTLVAWRVLRWWSAVALALLAPAATLAAERLFKLLVARRAPARWSSSTRRGMGRSRSRWSSAWC
jgi:hypothetical protein